ncbi:MAG: TonB-dependent receptor [Sulfurimonas sp.]|nr:TonB-dependent receptor [Sulfurimonas sp.]
MYGAELSSSYFVSDDITLDSGVSYKVGKKDEALGGQNDKDLADMAPLRANIALNYEYANNSIATMEVQASDKWSRVDSDNGEQKINGWAILNMKAKHTFSKNIELTLGVNNLFDKTYAVNNTYVDLTLITTGGADDVMLMNEPGRYIYSNLTFKF